VPYLRDADPENSSGGARNPFLPDLPEVIFRPNRMYGRPSKCMDLWRRCRMGFHNL